VDDLFYAMERTGAGNQPGLVLALNNSGGTLRQWVQTRFKNMTLIPKAWRAHDALYEPQPVTTRGDGWCEVEAPQRGYVVYGV
jgi:alpha-amylase